MSCCAKFISVALILLLCACEQLAETPPPGTLASVNGEYISLDSVQSLLDSRQALLSHTASPSLQEMQSNYGQALAILIAHALIRQELASRGLAVSPADLDACIAAVREDFGGENLDEYLANEALRMEDWRQLMADMLALDIFNKRLLLPAIKVSLEEIRAWYAEHAQDFDGQENFRICYASGSSEELAAWCAELKQPGFDFNKLATCNDVLFGDIPDPWRNELNKLAPGSCGKFVEEDGKWQTIALLKRNAAARMPLSEAYPLIENILIEQKRQAAFDAWLTHKIDSSIIKTMPGFFGNAK